MGDILSRLLLIALALVYIGCGEEQERTGNTVSNINAIVSVRGILYLAAGEEGVFRFDDNAQSWNLIGPFHPAATLAVDNTTLYVGSYRGLYRVNTDGNTATNITPYDPSPNRSVTSVAVEGDTILAIIAGNKLYRSTDGGKAWHQIHTIWHDFQMVYSMVVNGESIYVFTETQSVFRSVDGGNSWTAINGLPDIQKTFLNWPLLLDIETLYIGTTKGIYRLKKGTTKAIPSGLENQWVVSLVTEDTTLYAGTWGTGVFRSDDGGKNWQYIGLEGRQILTLAVFDKRLYAGTEWDGLFYTDDEGTTWHPLNKGLDAHD